MAKVKLPLRGVDIPGCYDQENTSHYLKYNNRRKTVETWGRFGPDRKFTMRVRVRPMVGSEIIHAKLKGHTRTEVLAAYGIKEVWPPVPPTLPPPPKLPKWLKLWRRFQSWQLKKRQLIMHRKEMEALHFRITQLKGPDLEVNRLVGEFLGWKDVHHDPISDVNRGLHPVTGYRHVLPDFTGSYDDAIASFPKEYRPSFGEKDDDVFTAYGHAKTEGPCLINYASSGKTGPTAILSVSIRIRIEQLDHQP